MARPTTQSAQYTKRDRLFKLLLIALTAIPATPLIGQENAGENAGESSGALEEIMVTATRRVENLQSIAIAVNVMDSEYLKSQHIDQIKDVIDKSPGTSFTLLNKMQNAYSMRGLSSQTEGAAGDPSILTVTDDVVIAKDYLKGAEFFDLERVEVLRGPQGTSFGRNATAGLIHLISKRPTRDSESYIRAGFGNYGHAEADGYINSAFGANGAARLAVHYTSHDGYTRDVVRNVDLGSEQNLSLRGSLLFNPGDDLEIYLKAEYSKDDDGAPVRQPRNCTSPQETYTNFIDPCSPWATAGSEYAGSDDTSGTVYNPGEKFYLEREIFNLTGQVNWSINDTLTLTSITGYIDGKGGYNMDTTGTPRDLQFSIARNDSWQFTQELRLDNLAAGEPLGWLFGLYYLTDDHDQTSGRRWFQEDLSVYGPGPLFTPTTVVAVSNNQTESLGVFGELNFDFTDKLRGTVGLRYTSDTKDFIISHNGTGRNGPVSNFLLDVPSNWPDPNNPATACAVQATPRAFRCTLGFNNARADESWDHLSYRASLTYSMSDTVLLYGTISEAYKTGGFNGEPQTAADAAIPYDEETALNYELGIKSEWASRFRLNATVFYVEYDDQQINVFRLSESGYSTQAIDNAAKSDVLGLEVDYLWQVTDNFRISGNFAKLDAELKDTQLRLEPGPLNDVSGNRPNNVPDWTGTMVAEYFIGLGNGSQIGLRADWRGRSSIYNDVLNSPEFERPGTNIFSARAAWYSSDDRWEVALYGKNLTEEADVLNIGPLSPFVTDNPVQFGPPRTYGMTVSYRTL